MKLKFKNQDFQTDAVNAIADLFLGQENKQPTFSIASEIQSSFLQNEFGVGNNKLIPDATLLANMQQIQKRNKLPLSKNLESNHFCVEMETGTGKTYVYTKTVFEMHKRFGFTKFIIVVPSVAIREGVNKSFELTDEHFSNQYDNVPYRYFTYNSSKLSDVRQFASSSNIEIMIINIDAFKKAENIINQAQDKLNGETAMRYIQDTHPIVIVDEPQSVDNTPKAKEAIASLNPLCVLRYSATHREKINLLYRLTPVDAYQMGLVKQICVSSNQISGDFNKPYIKLLSVSNDNGFKAKLEIDIKTADSTVVRKQITVKPGDDLFLLSNKRDLYDGYQIAGIDCTDGSQCVEFSNTEIVEIGKAIGSIDENLLKEAQIKRTIETHLNKELRYFEKGIKVLSLFFIDEVKKYRTADGEKGIYAKIFEKCYNELMALPKFAPLKEYFQTDVTAAHNGYFSQDKKGVLKDTKGDTIADDNTYNTIMRDKEWLLSFECPLRFIFSHSALKEGWDNPNVFQVCTLIEQKSSFTCRQKVGRGLRLPVDQDGNRIEDKNINILHVMANESFAEFADTLQKEIEQETGVKFGTIQLDLFAGMVYEEKIVRTVPIDTLAANAVVTFMKTHDYIDDSGKPTENAVAAIIEETAPIPPQLAEVKEQILQVIKSGEVVTPDIFIGVPCVETIIVEKEFTHEDASELMVHLKKNEYISKSGKAKDTLKEALKQGTLDLPQKFEVVRDKIENIITRADRTVPIRDASKEVVVKLNKQVMLSPEFRELWDKIKQKTAYRVNIDTKALVKNCVKELKDLPPIVKARIISATAELNIDHAGITHKETMARTTDVKNSYESLPDILSVISEETLITKDTIKHILVESDSAKNYITNPQAFLEKALEIIKNNRHALAIDGIKYVKLDGKEYFAQEIFDSTELMANLDKNAVAVEHSVYDHIVYDSSTIEKPFAVALDNDSDVKMFFKIPSRFKIDTPIGQYNPDWAVYLEQDGEQKLYFVLETKGSTNMFDLRTKEQLKIHCGKEHFKSLENGLDMRVTTNWRNFKSGF